MIKKLLLLILLPLSAFPQRVYVTDNRWEADATVYRTAYQFEADLLVYKTNYTNDASTIGNWYFVDARYKADWVIYYTDQRTTADMIIKFTAFRTTAGEQPNRRGVPCRLKEKLPNNR